MARFAPCYHPGYACHMESTYDADHALDLFSSRAYDELASYCRNYAKANDPAAQCMLGTLYQLGLGIEQNPRSAEELFLKAAQTNFGLAWCNLGTLYASGLLGTQDENKAAICYQRAHDLGAPTCIDYLDC